jgi:thiol-disulfide isomerase/thioredoxin
MMLSILFSSITVGLLSLGLAQDSKTTEAAHYPVGQVSLEEVLSFNAEYRALADSYTPKTEAVEFLHNHSHEITIEVFYGGWCGDSRAHLPSFIKLFELVDNSNITMTFVAVDREKKQPAERIQDRHIERVPTFIVYVDGRELGRIVETPEGSLEEHLVKIMKSVPSNKN